MMQDSSPEWVCMCDEEGLSLAYPAA